MKKVFGIILVIVLLLSFALPCFAFPAVGKYESKERACATDTGEEISDLAEWNMEIKKSDIEYSGSLVIYTKGAWMGNWSLPLVFAENSGGEYSIAVLPAYSRLETGLLMNLTENPDGSIFVQTKTAFYRGEGFPAGKTLYKISEKQTNGNKLPNLSHLKSYVKNPPYNFQDYKAMYTDPVFREALLALLGDKRTAKLFKEWGQKGLTETGPIQRGNLLWYGLGKPHDVGDHQVEIFINLGEGPQDPVANTIQLYWRDVDYRTQTGDVCWLATGQAERPIPPDVNPAEIIGWDLLLKFGRGTFGSWQIPAQ